MEKIIKEFYTAFSNLDAEEMVKHYHSEIIFEDPAFGILEGERAKDMWRMLCHSQKGKNFTVTFNQITSKGEKTYAKWEAFYVFSQTGKKVHNIISAEFEFKDGLIVRHTDSFNIHKWAKQAMGIKGFLLGSTSFFKSKLQKQTHYLLNNYIKKSKSNKA